MSLPHYVVPAGQVRAPRRNIFALDKVDHQRELSIPGPIFWHMVKNPVKPQFWEKFLQTCKYPFFKNKVIPVGFMSVIHDRCRMATAYEKNNTKSIRMDLSQGTCKFWLNDFVYFESNEWNSTLPLDRLYRCDVNKLNVYDPVPFNVYQKLTLSGTTSILKMIGDVQHPDGSSATVEQLLDLDHIPNLEKLHWRFGRGDAVSRENNSVKNPEDARRFFERLSSLKKLDLLILGDLPEQCFPAFDEFAKKNKTVEVQLCVNVFISAAYKDSIKAFMEEILLREKTGDNPLVKVPMIPVGHFYYNFDQVLGDRYKELAISTFAGDEADNIYLFFG